MNIKSLVRHVINKAVDRIVVNAGGAEAVVAEVTATAMSELEVDYDELAGHVDLEELEVDYETLAGSVEVEALAQQLDLRDVAGALDLDDVAGCLDSEDIAGYVDLDNLVYHLDYDRLRENIDTDDITDAVINNLDRESIAQHVNIKAEEVAQHINYAELSKQLSPMEALAGTGGEEGADPTERLQLDGIAGKLLDTAVDKLLMLANRQIEEDQAHAEVAEQQVQEVEEQVAQEGNGHSSGQSSPTFGLEV